MKKIISSILVIIMTAGISAAYADSGSQFVDGKVFTTADENGMKSEYYYNITDDGVSIAGMRIWNTRKLVIPAEIDGQPVTEIIGEIFETDENSKLTTLIIPDTVKKIGGSFYGQPNLKQVTLPSGLEYLGNGTFQNDRSLKEIQLPETLKTIGSACFEKTGLTSVSIPDGVEFVGSHAFADCADLENVEWDMTVKDADGLIFYNTPWLEKQDGDFLTLNNGEILLHYLGHDKKLTIPSTVKKICFEALRDSGVEDLTLPAGLKTLNQPLGCKSSLKSLTVSEGIEGIGGFADCEKLETVKLPETLLSIYNDAFARCKNLKSIKLPDGVSSIGEGAFNECEGLKSVKLPKTLETIGEFAFGKVPLNEVTIPQNVKKIDKDAFRGGAKKVKFLGSPKEIGVRAFLNTEIVEGLNDEQITKFQKAFGSSFMDNYTTNDEKYAFSIIDSPVSNNTLDKYFGTKTEVVVPDGVKYIASGAFRKTKVKKVVIPASVVLVHANFPATVESVIFEKSDKTVSLNNYAFSECTSLKELVLPEKMKLVSPGVVSESGDTSYYELMLPDSVKDALLPTPAPKATAEPTAPSAPSATDAPSTLEVTGGEEIEISVDGKAVEFDAKPFIDENDRTQVPVRAVSEMLDCDVDWSQDTQTVTITNGEKVITIVIGEDLLMVNGEKVQMDTKAIIKDERTFIPVRFIAEALGLTVEFR